MKPDHAQDPLQAGDLENLGASTVYILSAVGVKQRDQLEQLGAIAVYNRIRARGIRTSRVMLYSLHAAIIGTRWQSLSRQAKETLVTKADRERDLCDETTI